MRKHGLREGDILQDTSDRLKSSMRLFFSILKVSFFRERKQSLLFHEESLLLLFVTAIITVSVASAVPRVWCSYLFDEAY